MEFENTASNDVETVTEQEVVEPATEEETGSTEQEVAEPASEEAEPERQDSETNAAFQRMRHEKEQMQSELEAVQAELAEMQARQEARDNTFTRLTGREEDAEILALAEVTGMSEDEIRAEMEAAAEMADKDLKIQRLEEAINNSEAERLMQEDLAKIRQIDPSVKSLDELGEEYYRYMNSFDADGNPVMTPEDAYYAVKAKERANTATPPKEVGKVATGTAKKEGFTQAEIDAMSSDQLRANWKEIYNSWG